MRKNKNPYLAGQKVIFSLPPALKQQQEDKTRNKSFHDTHSSTLECDVLFEWPLISNSLQLAITITRQVNAQQVFF